MLNADTIEEKVPLFAKELQRRHTPQDWKQLLLHTKQLLTDLGSNNELKPEDYADINVPCLLMLGDRDKMVTLDETVNVYKKLQHGSLAVLPQTQHPIEKVDLNVIRFFLMHFLIPA